MTDYTELIRSLKACEHDECYPERCDWFGKYQVDLRCKNILLANAADAIEELMNNLNIASQELSWTISYAMHLMRDIDELHDMVNEVYYDEL